MNTVSKLKANDTHVCAVGQLSWTFLEAEGQVQVRKPKYTVFSQAQRYSWGTHLPSDQTYGVEDQRN